MWLQLLHLVEHALGVVGVLLIISTGVLLIISSIMLIVW